MNGSMIPEGIFASMEIKEFTTYLVCQDMNIKIPDVIKLICFSNLFSVFFFPMPVNVMILYQAGQTLNKPDNFYDYDKLFVTIRINAGREVVEKILVIFQPVNKKKMQISPNVLLNFIVRFIC